MKSLADINGKTFKLENLAPDAKHGGGSIMVVDCSIPVGDIHLITS